MTTRSHRWHLAQDPLGWIADVLEHVGGDAGGGAPGFEVREEAENTAMGVNQSGLVARPLVGAGSHRHGFWPVDRRCIENAQTKQACARSSRPLDGERRGAFAVGRAIEGDERRSQRGRYRQPMVIASTSLKSVYRPSPLTRWKRPSTTTGPPVWQVNLPPAITVIRRLPSLSSNWYRGLPSRDSHFRTLATTPVSVTAVPSKRPGLVSISLGDVSSATPSRGQPTSTAHKSATSAGRGIHRTARTHRLRT